MSSLAIRLRQSLLSLCLMILVSTGILTQASSVSAQEYAIDWNMVTHPGSCIRATGLNPEGGAFFQVNQIPIPTRTVPGFYHPVYDSNSALIQDSNLFRAPFSGALFRSGANDFFFAFVNALGPQYDACNSADNLVSLIGPTIPIITLFNIQMRGTAVTAATTINLSLAQVNPAIAADIQNLETAVKNEKEQLIKNADSIADLDKKLAQAKALEDDLAKLKADLENMKSKNFDEIFPDELEALLTKYAAVPPDVRDALVKLVDDLRTGIAELKAQIAAIAAEFSAQADQVAGVAGADAAKAGFDPNDSSQYQTGSGYDAVGEVAVPDYAPGSYDGTWDPYANYANDVIAQLNTTVESYNKIVADPARFMQIVRSWRKNQKALELALKAQSGLSNAEWGAFLNAQNRVTNFVRDYVDDHDWFKKSRVYQETKNVVDGAIRNFSAELAAQIKESLNRWPATIEYANQDLVQESIIAVGSGIAEMEWDEDKIAEADTRPIVMSILRGAVDAIDTVVRLGVGLTPIGDFVDFCEAATGWRGCDHHRPTLETSDRVAAGLGVGTCQR